MAIHGNKSQPQRIKALEDFKKGAVRVLVATDIAARGLDIDMLPHVVNFELPQVPEDYIHRIGRTGRAGAEGEALSLVCVDEKQLLKDIEKLLRKELPKDVIPGFAPDPSVPAEPIQNGRSGGGGRGGRSQGTRTQSSPRPAGAAARASRGNHPARPSQRGK
jgi:ATP-dependent RNA helicase RhlE